MPLKGGDVILQPAVSLVYHRYTREELTLTCLNAENPVDGKMTDENLLTVERDKYPGNVEQKERARKRTDVSPSYDHWRRRL